MREFNRANRNHRSRKFVTQRAGFHLLMDPVRFRSNIATSILKQEVSNFHSRLSFRIIINNFKWR